MISSHIKFINKNVLLYKFISKNRLHLNPGELYTYNNISEQAYHKFVSILNFSGISKTTSKNRHPISDNLIIQYANNIETPTIIDIGASDGITSLDLINKLGSNFSSYFVTDKNINVYIIKSRDHYYFFDQNKECILICNKYYFLNPRTSILFKYYYKYKLNKIMPLNQIQVPLINPHLVKLSQINMSVIILQYDLFQPWEHQKANIIKIANLLNQHYFTGDQIKISLFNCLNALVDNGLLFITHNTYIEKITILKKVNDKFVLLKKVNGGVNLGTQYVFD